MREFNRSRTFHGALVACVTLSAGTASAAFDEIYVEDMGDLGSGGTSYRIYVRFDDPADQVIAISADAGYAPIAFQSNEPLIQNVIDPGNGTGDRPGNDAGGDSWVTIGPPGGNNTQFSPAFLGGDGTAPVIVGTSFSQASNGGWYDQNPATPKTGGQILIAQLTFQANIEVDATLTGTVVFNDDGVLSKTAFLATIDQNPPECLGDVNDDGVVDGDDLLELIYSWGPCTGCAGDLDTDNDVDIDDIVMLFDRYGLCPGADGDPMPHPSGPARWISSERSSISQR